MELRRGVPVAGFVVFISLMLAGRTASAAPVDVCSLLTLGQAASALGVPEATAVPGPNRCTWTPKKYQKGAGTILVMVGGATDGAQKAGVGTPVPGVGDEAIETVVSEQALLHVRKGNTWFVVSVHGVPVDQSMQVEKTVALQVAPQLGAAVK